MVATTNLSVEKYKITDTVTFDFKEQNLHAFIQETLFEASTTPKIDIVSATYGKYSNENVNLLQALLDEHESERDREKKS